MKNFDIIIIGAGPGGSIAAKIAADNGYSTCFIEKEKLPKGESYPLKTSDLEPILNQYAPNISAHLIYTQSS